MKPALILTILIGIIVVSQGQVLGVDFGTQFWKAALISPGKNLVIVENSRSQRKTLNSIAFHDGLRFFQDESNKKRMKKPQLSYFYLNRLIKSLDDDEPLPGYQFQGDTYTFEEGDQSMELEQVVAMILKNIKTHASQQAGTDIKDAVLAVPSNWGFKAKMSLVNAAYLAQLSVLGLVNENSAAAVHFAISRNDTDPVNIVFFNLGSHNLQISVMKMFGYFDEEKNKTIESLEALSHVVAENVGGLKIDEEIAHYLADEFNKKHNINPRENLRSFTKLLVKSAEVKETLSANRDTNVYLEGLIDGIDLNLGIKRSIIDESNTFLNFEKYLNQALEKAQLTKDQIHSVEMIGGASRIPKVNSIVKSYFTPVEVGAHINGDQAMAFGCALRAANLSLTFRVKQLHFYDGLNVNTKAVISTASKGIIYEQNLFTLADQHGHKKTIAVPENNEEIQIKIYGGDEVLKEYTTKGLPEWRNKLSDQNLTHEPETIFEFSMSSVHIADLKDAYVNITTNTTQLKEKVEYVEQEQEVEVKEQDQKSEGQGNQSSEEKNEENPEESENKEQASGSEQTKEQEKHTKKQTRKKTKTVKTTVQEFKIASKKHIVSFDEVFSRYKKFTKDTLEEKKKILQKYEDFEKYVKDKAKIRNDFESALYHLKENFDDQGLKMFSQESQLTSLKEIVTTELEWMEENAWTAEKDQFQEHFHLLTDTYEPIYNRTVEYKSREKTYNESFKYLGAIYQKTEQLLTSHSWISEQVNGHLKKINETALLIQARVKMQVEKPLNQKPIIYNHEMVSLVEELRDTYYLLKMIPRPKVDLKPKQVKIEAEEQVNLDNEENEEETQEQVQEQIQNEEGEENLEEGEEKEKKGEDL